MIAGSYCSLKFIQAVLLTFWHFLLTLVWVLSSLSLPPINPPPPPQPPPSFKEYCRPRQGLLPVSGNAPASLRPGCLGGREGSFPVGRRRSRWNSEFTKVESHNLLLFLKLLSIQCLWNDTIPPWKEGWFSTVLNILPLLATLKWKDASGSRTKSFAETEQKDITLKTEMFIKDNCRLPRWRQTETQLVLLFRWSETHSLGSQPGFQFGPVIHWSWSRVCCRSPAAGPALTFSLARPTDTQRQQCCKHYFAHAIGEEYK